MFHSLDLNKDGRVDPEEMEKALQTLGYAHVNGDMIKASDGFIMRALEVGYCVPAKWLGRRLSMSPRCCWVSWKRPARSWKQIFGSMKPK